MCGAIDSKNCLCLQSDGPRGTPVCPYSRGVLTLRAAGELLTAAESLDDLAPIATALGCSESNLLDASTRHALGLDGIATEARIAQGIGATRVLLLRLADAPVRDLLPTIASRLSARAPHVLWLVVATQPSLGIVAIAAWTNEKRPPRARALIADARRVVDSDAETLRALVAAVGPRDLLTHARWVEILGRDALTARFYRRLERAVDVIAGSSTVGTDAARRELALLDTSRLLFLCFLEAKGWLDGDRAFLANRFDACLADGGHFHRRVLRPLFFGTLNTPPRKRAPRASRFGRIPFLNGGLFARTHIERATLGLTFSDDAYGALIYDLFAQYRFTAAEESVGWSEAAVDPEMLGRAFESLMASGERRNTGAFFTPFSLVQHVADLALDEVFANGRVASSALSVLDPACGSGAFLVHVLERIAGRLATGGDSRDVAAIRRDVLTRSIFGVDVNPTAVWLCQLRLWLSVVIESDVEDPLAVAPLPNLDRNIRVGDALAGASFEHTTSRGATAGLRRLRERYTRATGARKQSLARQLDRAERARAVATIDGELALIALQRRDLISARRGRDLFGDKYQPTREQQLAGMALRNRATALRRARRSVAGGGALPFSFPVHFGDVASRGGFSLVVGNPPWVRLHRIPAEQRIAFRRDFEVARSAPWVAGATAAGAASGFAAQVDLAALFIERAVRLTAPDGALALLVPAKLWRSLAGGGVRRFITSETTIRRVEDYSDATAVFDAAVYPSLVVLARRDAVPTDCIDVSVHHHGERAVTWRTASTDLAFDNSPGAPWILLPPEARRAFARVQSAGTPLADSPLGRPLLGVKCGCNDAFIVTVEEAGGDAATVVAAGGTRVVLESSMLRPLLRGERLRRWRADAGNEALIWTHDALDAPLQTLPTLTRKWLQRWRPMLSNRSDARRRTQWWSLFRTESARCAQPRVVWGDVGREPRAIVLDAGDASVPLNTCYVVRCRSVVDAYALCALLNSPLARAWLDTIAEPARGGYHRYLGWTIGLLPVPSNWKRARSVLAPLAERACVLQHPPSDAELLEATLAAYALDHDDVAPLVAWMSR